MRRIIKLILISILIFQIPGSVCWAAPIYSGITNFLFELGLNYYNQGRYADALHEFKKALIIQPGHEKATQYIQLIQKLHIPAEVSRQEVIQRALDDWEAKTIAYEIVPLPERIPLPAEVSREEVIQRALEEWEAKTIVPEIMPLPKRVGEISLFINGQEAGLEKPILRKEEVILIPLQDIARGLNFSVLDLGEGRFRLISPEGLSQEGEACFVQEIPMISQKQVNEYFSVESSYDDLKKALFVWSKYLPKFKTYLVESKKKPEELEELPVLEEIEAQQPPKYIPEAARASVDLKGNMSYLYRDYYLYSTYHSQSYSLWGRFYDFDLRYQTNWQDIAGKFDHDYTYLNLNKEDLWISLFDQSVSLYPLRNQGQSFTGLKLAKGWGSSNKTTFFGGDIENYISGTGGTVKYLGQIIGIEEELKPLNWLSLKGAVLYMDNNTAQPFYLSGTTSFPRNNLIYFMDNSLRLNNNLTLFSQLSQCNYNPDNDPDQSLDDFNWRTGYRWDYPRGRVIFDYEFVGDEYASLGNPLSYQDYKGWQFYTDYKVTDRWWLSSSFRRYQDNVDEDSGEITTKNQAFSFSSSHQILKDQSFILSFNRFSTHPFGPGSGSSSKTNLYRMDYFLPFLLDIRLFLNYQYSRTDVHDQGDYYSHNPGLSFFKSFGRGSSWYVRQDFIKALYEDQTDTQDYSSSFNLHYILSPRWILEFDSTYTHNKNDDAQTDENLSGSVNFRYQLNPKTNLNLEYAVGNYDLKTENKWPRDWSVMVYLQHNFDISSPPNFGTIKGRVILDLNANGKFDPNEPGIKGAKLRLEDGRESRADEDGYFSFAYVSPGMQKLYIDLEDLPLDLICRELEKDIRISPRKETEVDFLLIKSATIRGMIFIDDNNDLVFQNNEEPIEGITVLLQPGEQFRQTDQDGNFIFDYLLPRRYKIKIYSQDIPTGCRVVSPEEIEFDLTAGQDIKDVGFVLEWKTPIEKF